MADLNLRIEETGSWMISSMADPRYSASASMEEDPIYRLKKLNQTGSIKDYYEEFDSIRRCINLPEEFFISWFIAGLKMDTRKEVQSIRPQSVLQAYAYGRLYELAYPKGRLLQSNPIPKSPSSNSCLSTPISVSQVPSPSPDSIALCSSVMQDGDHVLQSVQGAQEVVDLDPKSDDQDEEGAQSKTEEFMKLVHIGKAQEPKSGQMVEWVELEGQSPDDARSLSRGIELVELELGSKDNAHTLFDEMPEQKSERLQPISLIKKQGTDASKLLDEIPKQEAAHCMKFIHTSMADGGKVFKISNTQSFVDHVGAVNNLVFNSGGRNREEAPKEMMKADFDEFILDDRAMGEPREFQVFDKMSSRDFKGNEDTLRLNKAHSFMDSWIFDPDDCIERLGFTASSQQLSTHELIFGELLVELISFGSGHSIFVTESNDTWHDLFGNVAAYVDGICSDLIRLEPFLPYDRGKFNLTLDDSDATFDANFDAQSWQWDPGGEVVLLGHLDQIRIVKDNSQATLHLSGKAMSKIFKLEDNLVVKVL